jgi:hypothetical protein
MSKRKTRAAARRRHKVHLFAYVRVEFWVEGAKSPEEAAERVMADEATHRRLYELKGPDFEFAEDWDTEVVVDTYVGDELLDYTEVDVKNAEGN